MSQYVAFLRAVNVGGHVVKMDRLRTLFEELGFGNVQTFIASGNVIFETPGDDAAALEAQIEQHLTDALGYPADTFLRSTREIAAIAACQPFPDSEPLEKGQTLTVVLLKNAPDADVPQKIAALRTETDDFHVHGREVYWLCRVSIARSTAGIQMGKALALPGTARNINTVRRLAAKYPAPLP